MFNLGFFNYVTNLSATIKPLLRRFIYRSVLYSTIAPSRFNR